MDASAALLVFSSVTFAYPGASPLFHDLSLTVREGDFLLITGPSGGGKSTLLRLACRLEEPAQGEISFRGRVLAAYEPPQLRRSVAYIQQTPVTLDASVKDNLLLPFTFAANKDRTPPDDAELARRLESFLLSSVSLSANAMNLSVGQRQRLSILRSLLLAPEVLLMDEPTSALDPDSRTVVENVAEHQAREGKAVLFISHAAYTPKTLTPRRIEVLDGQVRELAEVGEPEEVTP